MSFDLFQIPFLINPKNNPKGSKGLKETFANGPENALLYAKMQGISEDVSFFDLLSLHQHKPFQNIRQDQLPNLFTFGGKGKEIELDKHLKNTYGSNIDKLSLEIPSFLVIDNLVLPHYTEKALPKDDFMSEHEGLNELFLGDEITYTKRVKHEGKDILIDTLYDKIANSSQMLIQKGNVLSHKGSKDDSGLMLSNGAEFAEISTVIEKYLPEDAYASEDKDLNGVSLGEKIINSKQIKHEGEDFVIATHYKKSDGINMTFISKEKGSNHKEPNNDPKLMILKGSTFAEKDTGIEKYPSEDAYASEDKDLNGVSLGEKATNTMQGEHVDKAYVADNKYANKSLEILAEKEIEKEFKEPQNTIYCEGKGSYQKEKARYVSATFEDYSNSYDPASKEREVDQLNKADTPNKTEKSNSDTSMEKGNHAYKEELLLKKQEEELGNFFNLRKDGDFERKFKGQEGINPKELEIGKAKLNFVKENQDIKEYQSLDFPEILLQRQGEETDIFHVKAKAKSLTETIAKAIDLNRGASSVIKVRIYPEELGEVEVRVAGGKEKLLVKIFAVHPETKDLIEMELGELKDRLLTMGYGVQEITVNGNGGEGASHRQDLPKGWARSARGYRKEKDSDSVIALSPSSLSNISLFA